MCCITNLAKALDDFINNHQQYPYVFVDRPNKKKRTGNYIADNGLETIFQKCFLTHIKNQTENYKVFDISETHGVALAEKKDVRSVKGYKLGIQFQNGSFKAQILNENSKADAFWNVWGEKIKKTENGVEINKSCSPTGVIILPKVKRAHIFLFQKGFPIGILNLQMRLFLIGMLCTTNV